MRGVALFLIVIFLSLPSGIAAPAAGAAKAAARARALPPSPAAALAREEAALALISFPWQDLHYEIVFLAPRRGFRAMTIPGARRIEIYARPEDDVQLLAYDIAHELGHAIDVTYNTQASRKQWMEARGIDPLTVWFGCDRCSDYRTPAGDFAETFALLLMGPGNFAGRIAPPPTTDEIPALAAFFPRGSLRAQQD